jgi:SAM-dependent methyltransferase
MERPLYDQLVPYYEVIEGRDWRREVALIVSILRGHGSRVIVDLGCGTGYHARRLTKLGFDATGVDISRRNIQFAKKKARQDKVHPRWIVGSYYDYRPSKTVDAALCLNWSIPTRDDDLRRFLANARSLLRIGGLLIFDYERVSQIVWGDVGKPMVNSWNLGKLVIVRVSMGHITSNVLYSRDVYVLYPKPAVKRVPTELTRYTAVRSRRLVYMFSDCSYVRFFSIAELRRFGTRFGFRMVGNYVLPRNGYKRNYIVLKRTS